MTKSFLITAALILAAGTAWAQQGSTGANSVGSAFSTPAAPSNPADGTGASTQVQNAGPDGSTGGNNVGAAVSAPTAGRSVGSVPHAAPTHQ